MKSQGTKKATGIFVARIPQSVDESMFRRHFEAFGEILDLYMPKVRKFCLTCIASGILQQ